MNKERLTISVDPELAAAAAAAVSEGRAESVSAWVADAIRDRVERDARLAALAEAVEHYEAEHGTITAEELAQQERADRDEAAAGRARRRRGAA
jgi:hypothetical protein